MISSPAKGFWTKTRFTIRARPRGSKQYVHWEMFDHVEFAQKWQQIQAETKQGKWTYPSYLKPVQVDQDNRILQ